MFQEYTAIIINELYGSKCTTEVYLHFNELGKLIHAYCWKDDVPCLIKQNKFSEPLEDDYGYKEYRPKVKEMTNQLFVKLPLTIANYFNQMFISLNGDKEDFNDDEIMLKALALYPKLNVD